MMEFLDYGHPGPPSGISQCSTAQGEAEESPLADRNASKWPEPELLTPLPASHVLKGIGSGLDSIRISTSPEPSIRLSISGNSSQDQLVLSSLKKLQASLRSACLEEPTRYNRKYIPVDKQCELITRDSVSEILITVGIPLNGDDLKSVVNQILPRYSCSGPTITPTRSPSRRKLFAILVMLGVPDKIFLFILEEIWDSHLPFQRNPDTQRWERHDTVDSDKLLEVACSKDDIWDPQLKDLFEVYQWYLTSPIFDMGGPELMHYSLHKNTPLPFIGDNPSDEQPVNGGFGEVRKVQIYPAHHTLTSKDSSFAVKCLKSRSEAKFNQEVEALRLFRNHGDPHLVKLLATYHDGDHYNLIFPWANGNLKDFWRRNPKPEKSHGASIWIAEQCFGIAEALRKIHYHEFPSASSHRPIEQPMKGRHGDIKPENILWFSSSDTNPGDISHGQEVLALSDFGLTRFHKAITASRQYRHHSLAVSPTYRAPEFDLEKKVSPLWDVWTLGCVYLEFLIWYLQGWDAVDEFSKQRKHCDLAVYGHEDKYFSSDKRSKFGAYRKLTVIRRIEELHNHPDCTEFIHDFLNLIANGMIRIRSRKRMDSAAISQQIREMLEKNKDRPAYCTETTKTFMMRTTNESDKKKTTSEKILSLMEKGEFGPSLTDTPGPVLIPHELGFLKHIIERKTRPILRKTKTMKASSD
ncbi:kinase-like domain-containing protein [Xylaria castorea]|nr:kinase-like domain-containing protein [Xylaria castorea]